MFKDAGDMLRPHFRIRGLLDTRIPMQTVFFITLLAAPQKLLLLLGQLLCIGLRKDRFCVLILPAIFAYHQSPQDPI